MPRLRKAWASLAKKYDALPGEAVALASVLAPGLHLPPVAGGTSAETAAPAPAPAPAKGGRGKRKRSEEAPAATATTSDAGGASAVAALAAASHAYEDAAVPSIPADNEAAMEHIARRLDAAFIPSLITEFLAVVESLPPAGQPLPHGSGATLRRVDCCV